MMYSYRKLIMTMVAVFLVSVSLPSKADTVRDLYTANWPVESQSSSLRAEATVKSFEQVLVAVSGSRDVLRSPTVRAELANVNDYLRRYSYQKLSAAEQMIYEKPLLLKATFDSQSVLSLLKRASQPIWGQDRPSGVYWIVVEENGKAEQRAIATEESQLIAAGLNISAKNRGLGVTLPLMDIEDQSVLSVSDVWRRFDESINSASKRYSTDYWVAGQLSNDNGQWQGKWLVSMRGETRNYTTTGLSSYEAINAVINRVADHLASKLSVVLSESAQDVLISIENIQDFQSFAKAQQFITSLGMVRSASAVEVSADTVLFKVESLTSPQNLIEAMKIGNNLQRSTNGFDQNINVKGDFHFVWASPLE